MPSPNAPWHPQIALTDGDSGDTLRSWTVKGEPLEVAAADGASAGGGAPSGSGQERAAFSAVTNKRMLYLLHAPTTRGGSSGGAPAAAAASAPVELTFQEQYGDIARHLWFGEGLVMVGFRSGRVVVVSPHRWAAAGPGCDSGVRGGGLELAPAGVGSRLRAARAAASTAA